MAVAWPYVVGERCTAPYLARLGWVDGVWWMASAWLYVVGERCTAPYLARLGWMVAGVVDGFRVAVVVSQRCTAPYLARLGWVVAGFVRRLRCTTKPSILGGLYTVGVTRDEGEHWLWWRAGLVPGG